MLGRVSCCLMAAVFHDTEHVCTGWVYGLSSQKVRNRVSEQEQNPPWCPVLWPSQEGSLLSRDGLGGRRYEYGVSGVSTELWPHMKARQHELILGSLKPDSFLSKEVQRPQLLAPRTAAGLAGASWGRQHWAPSCSRSRHWGTELYRDREWLCTV
jgi:hypothetical protein